MNNLILEDEIIKTNDSTTIVIQTIETITIVEQNDHIMVVVAAVTTRPRTLMMILIQIRTY